MMEVSAYARLGEPSGRRLLAQLERFTEGHVAAAAAMARKAGDAELAAAALSTAFARKRAARSRKFTRAGAMFFTRVGYEQASSEAIARHCAQRFERFERVVDLCCGIGSDSIAIAGALRERGHVDAVDDDLDALSCARGNAAAYGVDEKIVFHHADALTFPLHGANAVFADPSRRSGAVRTRDSANYQPPLADLLARCREIPQQALGVKVAPGLRIEQDELRRNVGAPVELEYISENGTCKEALLWCGELASADRARQATIINSAGTHTVAAVKGATVARVAERQQSIGAWLAEPDAAVIRAGLIATVCAQVRATAIDAKVAYLTADAAAPTPFVRWFEVIDALPFGVKRVRQFLRARDIGRIIVKTRAFPLSPQEIVQLLKPRGQRNAVLICTTLNRRKMAIVCAAPAAAR